VRLCARALAQRTISPAAYELGQAWFHGSFRVYSGGWRPGAGNVCLGVTKETPRFPISPWLFHVETGGSHPPPEPVCTTFG
jgi:hypothetical protein